MPSRFATDTAVEPLGGGRYRATMDRAWWVERGPNGGYVAAVVVRALTDALDDPSRSPRTISIHYLAPPVEGEAIVEVTIERTGRSMASLSARLVQDGEARVLALAVFGGSRDGPSFDDAPMPDVEPPERCPPTPEPPFRIPFRDHWDSCHALGTPPLRPGGGEAATEAVSGGWIRLSDPQPLDHTVLAAMSDAWAPAVLGRLTERVYVPTLDLTVHLRSSELPPTDGFCLVRFRSRVAREGYLEEDGEIWAPDGTLVAQSRQLAVEIRPPA